MGEKINASVNKAEEVRDAKAPVKRPFLIRFWWIEIILGVIMVVVAIAAITGGKSGKGSENNNNGRSNQQEISGYRDIFLTSKIFQKDAEVKFTVPPMPVDKITSIGPLGGANSGVAQDPTGAGSHNIPTDHIYVHEGDKKSGRTQAYDVSAVADGYLVQVEYQKSRWEANDHASRLDDYTLTFQYSKNLFLMVCHLTDLSPDIKNKVGNLTEGDQNFY